MTSMLVVSLGLPIEPSVSATMLEQAGYEASGYSAPDSIGLITLKLVEERGQIENDIDLIAGQSQAFEVFKACTSYTHLNATHKYN